MVEDTITVDGVDYVRAYPVAAGRCAHCGAGPRAWTPAQVLARLRRESDAPKADQWMFEADTVDRPTFSTVRRMFGTWNRALEAAGFGTRPMHGTAPYWTRQRIIEAMVAWAQANGEQPRYSEWSRGVAEHPSSTTVRKVFGTWNAAIDAAGFIPVANYGNRARGFRGPEGKRTMMIEAAPVVEAVRDYLGPEGEASRLAELMGVDESPLYRLLRGKRPRITHVAADEILTAIDRPDVLAALEPAA